MGIKDLAGLSQPITKLIEVVSAGVGKITTPYLIKKTADAKAYEIKIIFKALSNEGKNIQKIEYDKGDIKVVSEECESTPNNILNRMDQRIIFQQLKRQSNIEKIVLEAVEELKSEETISEERPAEDWVTRFFSISQDISSEEMQILWSKILASEVKTPNSYSLRTLDLLRNISTKEAEVFAKVGGLSIGHDNGNYLLNDEGLLKTVGISFSDQLLLEDLGLLLSKDIEIKFNANNKGKTTYLVLGGKILFIKNPQNVSRVGLSVHAFSKAGNEMLSLIEKKSNDLYLEKIAQSIGRDKRINFSVADITSLDKSGIHYSNERDYQV